MPCCAAQLITPDSGFRIRPEDIGTAKWDYLSSFGHAETEDAARCIIKFMKERGVGWEPFTYDEINEFYARQNKGNFLFYDLDIKDKYRGFSQVFLGKDNKYYVTAEFIARCFRASPINNVP